MSELIFRIIVGLIIFLSQSDDSVLTQPQRDRLYTVSQSYLAPTEPQAIQIAKDLNFIGDNGHPSNMCGPLAMGILREAGLVSPDIDLADFWYLNPRPNRGEQLLERTFPRDRYEWFRTDTSLGLFDFSEYPLYAGDFIYIYAGYLGTFEHVLVVTRVDEAGRAFTVTNIYREDFGYLIQELLLYDPTTTGVGIFYEWTDWTRMDLGITGFGGFSLWRPTLPIHTMELENED